MAYEIWEMESGNLAGDYPTAEKALAVVAAFVQREGPGVANTLTLIEVGPRRKGKTLASGARLVKMAAEYAATLPETHVHTAIGASEQSGSVVVRQGDTPGRARVRHFKSDPKPPLVPRKRRVARFH